MLFDRKPEAAADPLLTCPHDGTAMTRLVVEKARVDRCQTCGGTWFDVTELARVARDKEVEALASRIPVNASDSPFPCPRCAGRCVEGHVDEVEVDTCTRCHGVWLDRGELTEAKRTVHAERLVRAAGPGFRTFLSRL